MNHINLKNKIKKFFEPIKCGAECKDYKPSGAHYCGGIHTVMCRCVNYINCKYDCIDGK